MYISLTIPLQILLAIRLNNRARGHTVFLSMQCWDGGKPLTWAGCVKMNGGFSATVSLNLPQTHVWSLFSHPWLALSSLSMVNAYHLYTDYSALPLRSQVCIDGREVSSMPEGKWRRRREGREVLGGRENPLYIQTACLAGYPSGTASHFLSTLLSLLLSAPHLFYQQRAKWSQNQKNRRRLTTGQNTRLKMTKHTQAEINLALPPHWIPSIFPFPFLLPVTFTPTACPFPKTQRRELNKKSKNKRGW